MTSTHAFYTLIPHPVNPQCLLPHIILHLWNVSVHSLQSKTGKHDLHAGRSGFFFVRIGYSWVDMWYALYYKGYITTRKHFHHITHVHSTFFTAIHMHGGMYAWSGVSTLFGPQTSSTSIWTLKINICVYNTHTYNTRKKCHDLQAGRSFDAV
jgi:hypothetical protein